MGTIRTRYENSNEKGIKTHLKCECGIVGFYDADELVKWYGDCDYEIREYEKDYGDGIVIRKYLWINSDVNYDKQILEDREKDIFVVKRIVGKGKYDWDFSDRLTEFQNLEVKDCCGVYEKLIFTCEGQIHKVRLNHSRFGKWFYFKAKTYYLRHR